MKDLTFPRGIERACEVTSRRFDTANHKSNVMEAQQVSAYPGDVRQQYEKAFLAGTRESY